MTVSTTTTPALSVHLAKAGSGWGLVMQSGVRVACTVQTPLRDVLAKDFALTADQQKAIDVHMLDGKPVDDIAATLVPDGARLALAAGLPGVAGLAMKTGSPLRGMRPGITHLADEGPINPHQGSIFLALFSLALPLLAPSFLARGVGLSPKQFLRYARVCGAGDTCLFHGQEMLVREVEQHLIDLPEDAVVQLTACLPGA